MRKIFIDGGANKGQSIKWFRSTYKNIDEYEIHCFEPNPNLFKYFDNLDKVKLHTVGLWTDDNSDITFYIGTEDESSSIKKEKTTFMSDKKIEIKTIDFSKWIFNNFNRNDFIVLKLDIEGAEYDVLDKMINDDTLSYINDLYVEFHGHKMNPNISHKNKRIIDIIEKTGINFTLRKK